MKQFLFPFLFFLNIFQICAQQYAPIPEWYADYDVKFYKIDVEADDASADIRGHAEILAQITVAEMPQFTLELAAAIKVDSLFINGIPATFRRDGNLLHIILSAPVRRGEMCRATVFYAAESVKSSGFFSAISRRIDSKWNIPVTWTLTEPFNALNIFPCKQHLPDKADSAHIFVTVPAHLKAGAPGLLEGITKMPDGRMRYEWKTRYPVAYYLISFAVADYAIHTAHAPHTGDPENPAMPIHNYIYNRPGFLEANKSIMDTTAALIRIYSQLFGAYPFAAEKYGHCVAPMGGGMENQTMTTLSDFNFLLVAHELAHQWFGNMVTCSSFQDVWINEGFASYAEYLALEKLGTPAETREWLRETHAYAIWSAEGALFIPAGDATNEWRIFDMGLSYKKGALLVHQIRHIIGNDAKFFATLRSFLEKYRFGVASADDFRRHLEACTGLNFTRFFAQRYYGEGHPIYNVSWQNADDGNLTILVEQTGSSSNTPLFDCDLDVQIKFVNGAETLVRMPASNARNTLTINLRQVATQIAIDPAFHTVRQVLACDSVGILPTDDSFVRCSANLRQLKQIPVTFSEPTQRNGKVWITDLTGKTLFVETAAIRKTEISLPVRQLNEGSYLLHVRNGRNHYVRKIVKTFM